MTGIQGFAVVCRGADVPALPEPCSAVFTSWDDFSADGPLSTDDTDNAGVPYVVADGSGTDPDQFIKSGGVLSIPGVIDGGAGIWFQQLADMGGCCDGLNYAFDVSRLTISPDAPLLSMITGFCTIGAGPDFSLSGVGVVVGSQAGGGIIIPSEGVNVPLADLATTFSDWDGGAQAIVVGDRVWLRIHQPGSDWVMDLYINGVLVQTYTLTAFDPTTATNYGAIMKDEDEIGIGNKSIWCEGAQSPYPELAAPEITFFTHENNSASGQWNAVAGADHYLYRFCYGTADA